MILQYSQHPNFYFTIQHIKIIFLRNKIIYPKTQIKTKTQITSTTTYYHHHDEEHTQTETHGNPPTITTMNPHMTYNKKNPTPFHPHHGNPQLHHHEPTQKIHPKIKSNQTNSKFQIQKMTHKKNIKSKFTQNPPLPQPISRHAAPPLPQPSFARLIHLCHDSQTQLQTH